jgi:hypothetical protein
MNVQYFGCVQVPKLLTILLPLKSNTGRASAPATAS